MATWSPDKLLASAVRIAMPAGDDIEAVVTSINADYPSNTGMAEYSVGWRSMDGQYHGSSRLSHEEVTGWSEGAIITLRPDSVFKEYNQPFDKPFYGKYISGSSGPNPFGSQPKPEVTVDLSQIEADLAKLPPAPVAAPLASLGYAKGTSPLQMAKEALDSLAAASEVAVAQLKEFEAAKNEALESLGAADLVSAELAQKLEIPPSLKVKFDSQPIAKVSSSKTTKDGIELELTMNMDAIDAELLTAQFSAKPYPEPPDPFLEIVKHAAQGVEEELFHATGFLVPPPKPNTYTAQHQLSLPNGVMLGVQLTVVVKDPIEWFNPLTAKGPPTTTPPAPWPLISEKFIGSKPKAPAKGKKEKEDPA